MSFEVNEFGYVSRQNRKHAVKRLKKAEKSANSRIFLRNYCWDFFACHKFDLDLPCVLKKNARWFVVSIFDDRPN